VLRYRKVDEFAIDVTISSNQYDHQLLPKCVHLTSHLLLLEKCRIAVNLMMYDSGVLCRFWCQLIHDSSLHHCIDSYLNEARRPHDVADTTELEHAMPSDVRDCQMSLHRLFFLVCLRSSTHRESPSNFIEGKVFGDILYENYIFDIPRLMDICVVYGHGNDTALVSKMIGNVFQQQPKYSDDLRAVVPTIEKVVYHFNIASIHCQERHCILC